jgi:hypothetical protein
MTNAALKDILRSMRMPVSGTKAELIKRIKKHRAQKQTGGVMVECQSPGNKGKFMPFTGRGGSC